MTPQDTSPTTTVEVNIFGEENEELLFLIRGTLLHIVHQVYAVPNRYRTIRKIIEKYYLSFTRLTVSVILAEIQREIRLREGKHFGGSREESKEWERLVALLQAYASPSDSSSSGEDERRLDPTIFGRE